MYFVTVSEMLGSGGEKVARKVAENLNYPFYAKEELYQAADQLGYLADVSHLEMKSPHLLEKYFSDKPKIYLDRFQTVIYEVAKKGNALFFGKGSQLLLHNFDCALHVLVEASSAESAEAEMFVRPAPLPKKATAFRSPLIVSPVLATRLVSVAVTPARRKFSVIRAKESTELVSFQLVTLCGSMA